MNRTSRRVSRPLIGVLAVVIVLGIFFTIHKLHSSHAAEAKSAIADAAPSAQPAPAPASPVIQPAPQPAATEKPAVPTTEPSHPVPAVSPPALSSPNGTNGPAPEADALVTQTPTTPVTSNIGPSDAIPPTTRPTESTSDSSSSLSTQHPTATSSGQAALSTDSIARADLPPGTRTNSDDADPIPQDFIARARANSNSPPISNQQSAISNSGNPLGDAKTKSESGDLISSRQLLNDALISGRLAQGDADAAKKQIEEINKTLVFSARRFPEDPWAGVHQVAGGERLATIAARSSVSWELLSKVNGITPKKMRAGQPIKIFKGPFHAVVYKKLFRLEIYLGAPGGQGSMYITSYQVGLGRDDSTPTGLWLCKAGDKIRNPRYYPPRGGEVIEANDPKNPLGGYWIALEGQEGQALGKESYGIHGTIEPDSIGKQQSMGCIRLRADDIAWVFDLLVDGKSKVLVRD